MREYEETKSNIDQYIDKVVEVADVSTDTSGDMTITKLKLVNGDEISTTSDVIAKQSQKEKEKGLPFKVKIISKKSPDSKQRYYTFGSPNQ